MRNTIVKKQKKIVVIVLLTSLLTATKLQCLRRALIIVPIADLVGSPIKKYFPTCSPEKAYKQIPLNRGLSQPALECPRLHQALFNETVEIIEERDTEALIAMPHAFYLADDALKNEYWILKTAYIPYDALEKKGVDLAHIPPIFGKNMDYAANVVTLTMPFRDAEKQITYSAGTRFVTVPEPSNNNNVAVYALDPSTLEFNTLTIPHTIISEQTHTAQEKIEQCVSIAKRWANLSDGFIPYGWGCSSFAHTSNALFSESSIEKKGTLYSYITLEDFPYTPKPGFDCSNMILRAAQIAGIPYSYKNSSAAAKYLKNLHEDDEVEIGDIIWIPGHVMMVSDIKKNLLVEARGYNHGYGKVQEIELSKVFKNIKNYRDLAKALHKKQTLYRLDNQGAIADSFNKFKILKMKSVWG